jgi:predicted lipoprotein with Yx(FWY)xxD motif
VNSSPAIHLSEPSLSEKTLNAEEPIGKSGHKPFFCVYALQPPTVINIIIKGSSNHMKDLKIICLILMTIFLVYPLGALSHDQNPSSKTGSLTPSQEQAIWMAEAYRFLDGGYYPYSLYFYSSPYMPYPAQPYYPYYAPYYAPYPSYNAPYASPTQTYPASSQAYAAPVQVTTPTEAYPPSSQAYAAPVQATAPAEAYTPPVAGYTIMTANNPSIGTYLTDGKGITLYHLQSDQGSYASMCTDAACTGIWPPFYTGSINVPESLNPADFAIITVNGYKQYQQITFKGWPLYYFYRDTKPGDVYGQGLVDSYGVWSVVSPEGSNTFPADFPYPSGE